jgi:hypothetical protein
LRFLLSDLLGDRDRERDRDLRGERERALRGERERRRELLDFRRESLDEDDDEYEYE